MQALTCAAFALGALLLAILLAAGIVAVVRSGGRNRRGSGAIGTAMLEVHSLLEPGKRHTVNVMRSESAEEDDSGDPPER